MSPNLLRMIWTTELLHQHKRPPRLKFPLGPYLKDGRGSKSRAGFGNSCSASMRGLHGAAHGPPWQRHRPPAARKDVRWQSWRDSVQQAAGGQLTWGGQRTLKTQNSRYGNGDISIPNPNWATKAFPFSPWQLIWGRPPPPQSSSTRTLETNKQHKNLNQVYFWLVQKQQSVLTGTQPPVLPLTLQLDHKSGLRRIYWRFEKLANRL